MSDVTMRIVLQAVGQSGVVGAINTISSALGSGGLTSALSVAAATAVIGLGVNAVNAASDFQSSLAKVQAYAGMTQQQTEEMGKSILQMAPQLGEAPKALADSLYSVASAGFKGADGLNILKYAGMTAAASNSDATVITKSLVSSLNSLGLSASSAGSITDELNATVKQGLITWDQYGSVVGKIAGAVSAAGGSAADMQANFTDLNAALDVYTNAGINARQASMWLNSDMSLLYGKTDSLTKNAQALGVSFDQTAFTSMDFAHKIQYLSEITGGNRIELTKLLNGNSTVAQSVQFLSGHYDQLNDTIKNITGSMRDGKSTQDLFNVAQETLSFRVGQAQAALQALMITIGTQILPILSNLLGSVTPLIGAFQSWMTNADNVRPILIGLATATAITLIPVMWGLAAAVLSATWPFLALAAGAAGAAAIFQHFYETNAPFHQFIDGVVKGIQQLWQEIQTNFLPTVQQMGQWIMMNVVPALQQFGGWIMTSVVPALQQMGQWIATYVWPFLVQIGQFMASVFIPVWSNLVQVWQKQLMPLFQQLMPTFQQLLPLLALIGVIVAGVLLTALGLLVGVIDGLAKGIGYFVEGLATTLAGIVGIITGVMQVVGGIIQFFTDLFTGHFEKLVGDLQEIGQGIINIFLGLWNTVAGIFQAAWGLISGIVGGFVQGFLGFFKQLYDDLVGHSIIPDMINGVISWFSMLIDKPLAFVRQMVAAAGAIFGSLAGLAKQAWDGVWSAVKSGINNVIGLINSFIDRANGISINVPGVGNVGFSIPDIPYLYKGGTVTGAGAAYIADRGPELVQLPVGANVVPLSGSGGGFGGNTFIINVSTMARSQSEVARLVDMIEAELGHRVRLQTPGYSSYPF